MVPLILLIIGLVLVFLKRVSLTRKYELKRPKIIIVGVIIMMAGAAANFVANYTNPLGITLYVLFLLSPLIFIPFFKEPRLETPDTTMKKSTKVFNIIWWVVVAIIIITMLLLLWVLKNW